ncbi:hypothetical protein ACI3KS_17070 [Microbacterium sp. ZW T5_45]|uniref:hypothetical protein n=1 Tax=Microbacterium sp. ZW T5_45 TaxID=3378080 RepID=UPI003851DEBF
MALKARRFSRPRPAAHARTTGLPQKPFWYALVATLGVGVGMALLSAVSTLATVLTYVGIALFLSVAADPVLRFAVAHGMRRGIATLLLAILTLALVAGTTTAVIPTATAQVATAVDGFIRFFESLPQQEWFAWLSSQAPASIDLDGLLA